MTDRVETMSTVPASTTSKELLIVALAVAAVSLSAADPSFLVFVVSAGLALIALLRFDFFVYGLVLLLPWYPLLDFKPPFRDLFLLLRFLLLGGVWMIRRREGKPLSDWIVGNRLKKGVLLFGGVAAISLLASNVHSSIDAYRSLIRLFSYLAVFFAMSGWLESRRQVLRIIKLLLLSTIAVALFGYYQAIDGSYTDFYFHLYPTQEESLPDWNGRIPSFLFHFNGLAGYLNLVLPFAMGCAVLAKDRGLRILGFICQAMATAALFLTGSRGGLLAYGGMLLISFWFLRPKRKAFFPILLSIVLAAGLVLSIEGRVGGNGGAGEAGTARLQEVDEFTQQSRLALWGAAFLIFMSHPLLGVGYGNYRSLYSTYLGSDEPGTLDAHNLYLQLLADTGIIGFLIFCVLIGAFSRMAIRLARQPDPFLRLVGVGVGGALAATLIHGVVDYLFNANPQFGGLFWLVLALGAVAWSQRQTQSVPLEKLGAGEPA